MSYYLLTFATGVLTGVTGMAYEVSTRPPPPIRIVVPQPTNYYNASLVISAAECREACKTRSRMEKVQ